MPLRTTKPRKVADNSPAPRANRRKATPKQAKGPSDLSRHGRTGHQATKPMKFPGKLGGR